MHTNREGERMSLSLVTEKQAAEMTAVPRGTLRYWRHRNQGEGPEFLRIHGRIKYDVGVLEAWVNQYRHTFSVRASNGGQHGYL